ncbi:MAG: hypothetical protein HW392_1398 [Steroidobacteraceae bacterium]|nr:hypothetical protein [Steroidobacteraceae bacterium]
MQRKRLTALLVAAALATGCAAVDDWTGLKRRKETAPSPITDDGQLVAGYLATLDRLGRGGAAEQAEITQVARAAYLADPTTQHRMRYAFVLAVPGHAATDAEGARSLLGEALATPQTLLPSERALAELIVRELDARLALSEENTALRSATSTVDRNRIAGLNRRLQQETAEKERLRHELELAQAKLEAITALEGGAAAPKP